MDLIPILLILGSLPIAHNAQHSLVIIMCLPPTHNLNVHGTVRPGTRACRSSLVPRPRAFNLGVGSGNETKSFCVSVCLSVYLCLSFGLFVYIQLFSHYRLRGGLRTIPTASVLQGQEKINNVAILLKRLRLRDMA